MDYLLLGLIFVLTIYSYLAIKQDFFERKVSNKISFSLLIISFSFFVLMSSKLYWLDFIILFFSVIVGFLAYAKRLWGAADGKLFIGIMILLISFGHSEIYLRWVLNLFFFYSIVIILLSLINTSKVQKKSVLKKMDYIDSSLVILVIFFMMHLLLMAYVVDPNDAYSMILFFLVLIFFVDKVRKYLRKHFKKMFHDVKLMVFAILSLWLFLYAGGLTFLLRFGAVFGMRILVEFITDLSDVIKEKNGENYQSPFSLYLFLTAIFTLITARSFIEIIIFALV